MATLGLAACGTMSAPISGSEFDPLGTPGGALGGPAVGLSEAFRPGQSIRAAVGNTAFYRVRPRGDADADRLLERGTRMRVVSADSSYVRVELDSGEVGFVPAVMVEDPSAAEPDQFGNEFQVFPPTSDGFDPVLVEDPVATPAVVSEPSALDLELPVPPADDEVAPAPAPAPLPEPAAGDDPDDDEEEEP